MVVTIIILLILAGVTLNIALSDGGLFSKTKEAAEKYKQAQSDEEEMVRQIATQMYSEYVGATVTGYTPTSKAEGCTVGPDVTGYENSQTFKTDNMEWKVWDFDGNTLRIIGEPTSQTLHFTGATGYNNGVWAMDHICKGLYSNEGNGAIATNLKRTDIQKVSTYDYTQYKHEPDDYQEELGNGTENVIHFGESKTYSNENTKYPSMWNENDKNWAYDYSKGKITGVDKEGTTWEVIENDGVEMNNEMNDGNSSTKFKQSYYVHSYKRNEFINDTYYDLIFINSNDTFNGWYWLAGRCVEVYEEMCVFGLQHVNANSGKSSVAGRNLCNSKRRT